MRLLGLAAASFALFAVTAIPVAAATPQIGPAALATTPLATPSKTAPARTPYYSVRQNTVKGYAEARLYWRRFNNHWQVKGWFTNQKAGYSSTGWVEQSSDGGRHWKRITYYYPVNNSTRETGWHNDDPPLIARACFKYSFQGSATHCTRAF